MPAPTTSCFNFFCDYNQTLYSNPGYTWKIVEYYASGGGCCCCCGGGGTEVVIATSASPNGWNASWPVGDDNNVTVTVPKSYSKPIDATLFCYTYVENASCCCGCGGSSYNEHAAPFANSADYAVFVSQSIPTFTMQVGQIYEVSFTFRNYGSSYWDNRVTDPYNLGMWNPPDSTFWGTNRIPLPYRVGDCDEEVTFTFNVSPSFRPVGGTEHLQYRMVHDNVAWFGNTSTDNIITIVDASSSSSATSSSSSSSSSNIGSSSSVVSSSSSSSSVVGSSSSSSSSVQSSSSSTIGSSSSSSDSSSSSSSSSYSSPSLVSDFSNSSSYNSSSSVNSSSSSSSSSSNGGCPAFTLNFSGLFADNPYPGWATIASYGIGGGSEEMTYHIFIDWGDGTAVENFFYPGEAYNLQHAYASGGTYNVTMTAEDYCVAHSVTHSVTVSDPYEPPPSSSSSSGSSDSSSSTSNTSSSSSSGSSTLPLPAAPDEGTIRKITSTTITIEAPVLPLYAASLNLQMLVSGVWTNVDTGITAENEESVVTGLTPLTRYTFRYVAVNSSGTTPSTKLMYVRTISADDECCEVPAKPEPPTLVEMTPTSATIEQPEWSDETTSMKLFRDGVLIHTFTTEGEAAFEDTGLDNGSSYVYTVKAVNDCGDSEASDELDVDLISPVTITWIVPDEGEDVSNVIALIVEVSDDSDLDADTPVRIELFGAPLPNVVAIGNKQYRTYFDTSTLEYQGSITFTAIATDGDGFDSLPALRTVNVDNSLIHGVRWHDDILSWPQTSKKLDKVMVHGVVNGGNDPALDYWFRFYATSPKTGLADDYDDYTAMRSQTDEYQQIDLDVIVELLGTSDDLTTDNTAQLRIEATPVERLTKYQTGTTSVSKMRYVADDVVEVFGTNPAKYHQFDKDGLTLIFDLETIGLGAATDATKVGDKLHVICDDQLYLVDLDSGDVTLAETPFNETRVPTFVENVGGVAYWVYIGVDDTKVYKRTSTDTRVAFTLDSVVTLTSAKETKLVLADEDGKLYQSLNGVEPALIFDHTAQITSLAFNVAGVVMVGDVNGLVLSAATNEVIQIADLTSPVRSLGEFKGAADVVKSFGGVDDDHLYRQNNDGIFLPVLTLDDATSITSMHRLLITLKAAEGDVLTGGSPAIYDESLLIGVTVSTTGEAYIARLQQADIDTSRAIRGQSISHLVFDAVKVSNK